MIVWLDGALVEASAARIDPADRGFTLGDGLFETLAARGGQPCHLDAHVRRLADGARVLDLPLPHGETALAEAMAAVLRANGLTDGVLRLTVTRGRGARGLPPPDPCSPTVLVAAAPPSPPLPPASAVVATVTRRNDASPLSRIKSLNYLDNILARQEARRRGADEAILLNTRGAVACATVANLFAVVGGELVTPPVEDGVLPGTRRARLLEQGAVCRPLTPGELFAAEEVFLTNSLGVRPVVRLDGRPVGDGRPGPWCGRLGGGP